MCCLPSLSLPARPHNVMRLLAEIAKQTFRSQSQWRLAWQVGTQGDTEGILFCGFRLHKHHYHLPDLELLRCSAATPILSGTLNGDARGLPGNRVNKKDFSVVKSVCMHVGTCVMCVRGNVRWLSNLSPLLTGIVSIFCSKQSFARVPLPD